MVTTKCIFSFRCTHATRHTPHTCQKSCREGGAERQGAEGGREGGEEEDRGELEGAGNGGRDGGAYGWRTGISRRCESGEEAEEHVGMLGDAKSWKSFS